MGNQDIAEENVAKGKFLGRFVIEILGTPKDHVKETLVSYVERLKEDKDLDFVSEYIAEPEAKGNAFSIYAELEIWIKGLEKLFAFCLDAMPSSVAILEPGHFSLNSPEFSNLLNDLQAKLHEVDLVVKQLRVKNQNLEKNAKSLLQNLILISLKTTPKPPDQLAIESGINQDALKPFLDELIKLGRIEIID